MHVFNMATIFIVLSLVGVEFSVSAFINPAARRLDPEPQLKILSRFASVFGKVMPVWYPVCALLLGVETWQYWRASERDVLLAALAIWLLASAASVAFLVPMNTRIAEGDADWKRIHRIWDKRHRVRTAALAIAAVLLTFVIVH
jgi:hypothetical protein